MTSEATLQAPQRQAFDWLLIAGLVLFALVLIPAIASLVWTPYGNTVAGSLAEPGPLHWLGTDSAGRDVTSVLMSAALSSLLLAGFATLICLMLGLPLGIWLATAYEDALPDVPVLSLPAAALGIALVVSGLGAPGNLTVILAIVLPGLPAAATLVAAGLRPLWRLDYVASARLAGLSPLLTAQRHVVPQLMPLMVAIAFDLLAAAVLVEATLAFAGLGTLPPGTSLGLMLRDGQQFLAIRPALAIAPGVVTVVAALGLLIVAARSRHVPG